MHISPNEISCKCKFLNIELSISLERADIKLSNYALYKDSSLIAKVMLQ